LLVDYLEIEGQKIPRFSSEFWTPKQRQSSSLHEISYRACFKAQLPGFFIKLLSLAQEVVYDPFSGRGTTVVEAGLRDRRVIANDINPLSQILSQPRFFPPTIEELEKRLGEISLDSAKKAEIDLSMFYQHKTEGEIVSLKNYLEERKKTGVEDQLDRWIRMVATNRLTGHSPGFFSVYTLPPNQAVNPERQRKINESRCQRPEYRAVKELILKKSKSLLRNLTREERAALKRAGQTALFLQQDARETGELAGETVQLTVTSPPFLDIVQYSQDNWLRCWFNSLDWEAIATQITASRKLEDWTAIMGQVFRELFRITKPWGWVAFEVGEVRKGSLKLDEMLVPLGLQAGFACRGILLNVQKFTKTSQIWGVSNNNCGTNTNRIILLQKEVGEWSKL